MKNNTDPIDKHQVLELLQRLGFEPPEDHRDTFTFSFNNGHIGGTSVAKDRIVASFEDSDETLAIYAFEGWLVTWQLKINIAESGFPVELLDTILTKAVS